MSFDKAKLGGIILLSLPTLLGAVVWDDPVEESRQQSGEVEGRGKLES
jgi:hypothetical protein